MDSHVHLSSEGKKFFRVHESDWSQLLLKKSLNLKSHAHFLDHMFFSVLFFSFVHLFLLQKTMASFNNQSSTWTHSLLTYIYINSLLVCGSSKKNSQRFFFFFFWLFVHHFPNSLTDRELTGSSILFFFFK